MTPDPLTGYVRVKAICVFRHAGRILVAESSDPVKREHFLCPPGGRVEFGGAQGHEIMFVYDAKLADCSHYERDTLEIREGAESLRACWVDPGRPSRDPRPLYPVGLTEFLARLPEGIGPRRVSPDGQQTAG